MILIEILLTKLTWLPVPEYAINDFGTYLVGSQQNELRYQYRYFVHENKVVIVVLVDISLGCQSTIHAVAIKVAPEESTGHVESCRSIDQVESRRRIYRSSRESQKNLRSVRDLQKNLHIMLRFAEESTYHVEICRRIYRSRKCSSPRPNCAVLL
jgi:hypothetical protein